MSAGTRTIGLPLANGTTYYFTRTWVGADGRWIVNGTKYREAWTSVRLIKTTKWISNPGHRAKKIVTWTVKRTYHPRKVIGHTKKLDLRWNNYSLSQELSTQSRTLPFNFCNPVHPIGTPLVLSANAAVTCQNRLVEAVRGHSFNMAVSGAQIGQTLDMIGHTIARCSKSIVLLKHGRFIDAARSLGATPPRGRHDLRSSKPLDRQDLANAWLELQYGWKPLLQDVHDAAHAMAYHTNPPRSTRISVSMTERRTQRTEDATRSGYTEGFIQRRITCELSETLSTARSLGLVNPSSVVWEVIPFSFVADWFIPIGTYLDNLSIIPNIHGRFLTTDISKLRDLTTGKGATIGSFASRQFLDVNRVVSGTLTTETPEFKPWTKSISTGHFWNSLALLTQLTK